MAIGEKCVTSTEMPIIGKRVFVGVLLAEHHSTDRIGLATDDSVTIRAWLATHLNLVFRQQG